MPRATLKDRLLLTRPWSVTAPLVPFLVGAGFTLAQGGAEPGGWLRWTLGLVSGILLVLACNLFNTWGDERSGVDRVPGAVLTTPQVQQGLFTLRQVFVFGTVLFVLAGLIGLPTLLYSRADGSWRFNVPLLVAALVGFWGAVNYSTGVKYKYLGLGVPMVAFLEGTLYVFVVVALLTPAYVTTQVGNLFETGRCVACHHPLWDAAFFTFVTLPVASLVGVILHGNDMRDIATDRLAGVRSVASALGPRGALVLFFVLHLLPYSVPLLVCALGCFSGEFPGCLLMLLPFLALPLTLRLLRSAWRDYRTNPAAPAWLELEKGSGGVHFVFGTLYALMFALLSFVKTH